MIRIPEELALEIEASADEAFEKAKEHFPLSDELWNSFGSYKEEILRDLSTVHDLATILKDPELRERVKLMCVKLGLIRRLERYVDPEYGPLTVL